jgi:pimeloyl-ACP methyl ester carboxylesterase
MDKMTGYAAVNGLHLYHEVQGEGYPLVLLHGGMLRGHGRTADIDREITPSASAGDRPTVSWRGSPHRCCWCWATTTSQRSSTAR